MTDKIILSKQFEELLKDTMRLVQLTHKTYGRRVAAVEEPRLRLLAAQRSVYALALEALHRKTSLAEAAAADFTHETLDYDPIYSGRSEWVLLPPLDHPEEPGRCLVSGTGLTHLASARNRQAMHAKTAAPGQATVTDSMRMFDWGVEGGKPRPGEIGVQPEWFYKGCGTVLRGHNEPLDVPVYAGDGGEEPEVVGLYAIGPDGSPWRLGLTPGNEFSDHVMERKNYLYLAPSKLRSASIGPELAIGSGFGDVRGRVSVERGGKMIWSASIASGEENMSHSLANLEHHHFKYEAHRRPGDIHVHYFGADAFSFGAGVALQDGDWMAVEWQGLGRALRNPMRLAPRGDTLVRVENL